MEKINEGQKFTMIVDYAHEKQSMTKVLETAQTIRQEGGKIFHLHSSLRQLPEYIYHFCRFLLSEQLRISVRIARASVHGTNLAYQAVVGHLCPSSCFTALGRGCNGCTTRRWGPKVETSPQIMICRVACLGAINRWVASQVAVAISARGSFPCLSC